MTAPALWTKHRPIARSIAREYRIPGLEAQDVEQEALIALWEASRSYDRGRGAFPPFARAVIHRSLTDLLRTARRQKRTGETVLFDAERDGQTYLPLIACGLPTLTPLEREAVSRQIDGTYDHRDRSMENASQAALRKLRAA